MTEVVKYIGLDVREEAIAVAVVYGVSGTEVCYVDTLRNENDAIRNRG